MARHASIGGNDAGAQLTYNDNATGGSIQNDNSQREKPKVPLLNMNKIAEGPQIIDTMLTGGHPGGL